MVEPATKVAVKFILGFVLFLLSSPVGAEVKLQGIEVEPHKYYDNFIIKLDQEVLPKITLIKDPPRLILDFKGVTIEKPLISIVKKSKRVGLIRAGQFSKKPLIGRVVLELKRPVKWEAAALYGRQQVMLEVADGAGDFPAVAVKTEPVKPPIQSKKTTKIAKTPVSVEVVAEKPVQVLKNKVIVIDPGHGGDDPGATGYNNVLEKNINLKTALYLAKYLKEKGANVFLTRQTDIKKNLPDIVSFANRIGADIYLGVHYNSLDNPRITGTETYYYHEHSRALADAVHRSLVLGIRRKDRGVRQAMLYTIHHTNMPAILLEPVYMTGDQEGALILSPSFQKEVARDIAQGVENYFRNKRS
ncbi:N-acetylmuramoyl-L-alanine amidase [Candidatus Saganbacteria bacterium]|nr:N-acetylmuramoyl-L-alanine amidase [Candidatus Saganbacteria bacterium]